MSTELKKLESSSGNTSSIHGESPRSGPESEETEKYTELIHEIKQEQGQGGGEAARNYTVSSKAVKGRTVSIPNEHSVTVSAAGEAIGSVDSKDLSTQLQQLINNNSELGSRLLSLLLVSSGNAKDIINAVNKGDLSKLKGLTASAAAAAAAAAAAPGAPGAAAAAADADADADADAATESVVEDPEELRWKQLEKRRKNTEASARFRIRKKQREKEKLKQLEDLTNEITGMYDTIDTLIEENNYWKAKLEELNEIKSKELLANIKKRSGL